jgi:hypothetical protein
MYTRWQDEAHILWIRAENDGSSELRLTGTRLSNLEGLLATAKRLLGG